MGDASIDVALAEAGYLSEASFDAEIVDTELLVATMPRVVIRGCRTGMADSTVCEAAVPCVRGLHWAPGADVFS